MRERIRLFFILSITFFLALPAITVEAKQSKSNKPSKAEIARISRADTKTNKDGLLRVASSNALIVNQNTGEVLFAKDTDALTSIASVTKLMTAMVTLDANLSMDEEIAITNEDVDTLKNSSSKLPVGTVLPRSELLKIALIASDNRAASALGRNYPTGKAGFVNAMNIKALQLDMTRSEFADPTGLNNHNMSTAEDLVKMVKAAYQYPEIREITTTASYEAYVKGHRAPVNFNNTNGLIRKSDWIIGLSKTGFIQEAGRCLVMQAMISGQPMIIVLLKSYGSATRTADANRIRKWIEKTSSISHLNQSKQDS
ncbi:MAG: serine hydrolase [Candidatus Methylopumilus sp.]|nr:serine hydrolase [Candidatus Methylopumilus sp.]